MAFVTEMAARAAAQRAIASGFYRSPEQMLREEASTTVRRFDIFLSHSVRDAELVLGAVQILRETGKTVYVDWIVDPQMNRDHVSAATARVLRERMNQCEALFYLHSTNASKSRWMPWELGYFDGHNGNVAIFPILQRGETTFKGEEYLGIYPYVDLTGATVFIHRDPSNFRGFDSWKSTSDKLRPAA